MVSADVRQSHLGGFQRLSYCRDVELILHSRPNIWILTDPDR